MLLTMMVMVLWPSQASAAPPPDSSAELEKLVVKLETEYAALESADCELLCQALESMIRSADRICALDRGAICMEARKKVASAKRRVRQACPNCSAAEEDQYPESVVKKPSREHAQTAEPAGIDHAPPAEGTRGGCAACSVGQHNERGGLATLLLSLALALVGYRRRKTARKA